MSANNNAELERLRLLPWGDLGRLKITLDDQPMVVEKVLRHLPGKRVAVKATWKGEAVFAKLFLSKNGAEFSKEVLCIREIANASVATPALLKEQVFEQGAVFVCQWCDGVSGEAALRADAAVNLPRLMTSIFSLYDAGFYQRDLHLNNFILHDDQFVVIDAGDIQRLPDGRAGDAVQIENLALFCAQGSLDLVDALERHVRETMQAKGLPDNHFSRTVQAMRNDRIRRAMKKWRRESSAIGHRDTAGEQWLWQRSLAPTTVEALTALLQKPSAMPLLKQGSRITVYGDDHWVVKHYRESGFVARLKRLFFRGRADISWVIGWTWRLLGVPTPQPVMLRRCKNGEAVIACERIEAQPLSHLMEQAAPRAETASAETVQWLTRLHRAGFWHGDTKAQNILCTEQALWFIDLDAAGWRARGQRHEQQRKQQQQRRAAKDMARFQRNRQQFVVRS